MTWKLQQTIWEIPDVTRLQAHKQLKDSVTDWSKQQWTKQSETKQNTGQTYKVTIHSLLYFITGPFKQHVKHQLQHYSWFTKFLFLFSFYQLFNFIWNASLYFSDKLLFIFKAQPALWSCLWLLPSFPW